VRHAGARISYCGCHVQITKCQVRGDLHDYPISIGLTGIDIKANAIANYRQKCCSVIHRGSRENARCTVLYSLGDSVAAAGSSGNATKLSSPLNFLFELLVSGDRPCSSESICSKGDGREMSSKRISVPQPEEHGSDFGQSFL
jgi:hypothetical protein